MHILDLIYPKRCVGCGRVGRYFCVGCASRIRRVNTGETICPICERPAIDGVTHPTCRKRYTLDGLTSFFHYEGVAQKAIKSFKFRFVSDLADEFVDIIFYCHSREGGNPSALSSYHSWIPDRVGDDKGILIPVPLHPSRARERGFNQAEVLSKFLAQKLGIPMRIDILQRTRKTASQVEVRDRDKRLKNIEGAFQIRNSQLDNLKILLFDDVWTTGATIRSAASALKRAGASFVWGVTMAR